MADFHATRMGGSERLPCIGTQALQMYETKYGHRPSKQLEHPSLLPADAQFKGYVREASRTEEVIVQEHELPIDNVLGRKQKYYSPSEGKTYLAELPLLLRGRIWSGSQSPDHQFVLRGQYDDAANCWNF